MKLQNDADVYSLRQIQNSKSKSYSSLKNSLGMTNSALVNYVKVNYSTYFKAKLIKSYDGPNMALNIDTPESK